ncbi:plasma membrane fusion protein prm1 [Savitreella phatthalungensis]
MRSLVKNLRENPRICVKRALSQIDGTTKPYLGLGARLSQSWVNKWTVLLVLVAIRLSLALKSVRHELARVTDELMVGCLRAEASASAFASAPHYLASGANHMVQHTVEGAVRAINTSAQDSLIAAEAVILFFINTFKSTYLCLLKFAITGTIDGVIDATEQIGVALNVTLAALAHDLQAGVKDANTALGKIASFIDKASAFLGQRVTVPTVSIPQIADLTAFQIPGGFDTNLEKVRSAIDLDKVQQASDAAISYPFGQLRIHINESLSNFTFSKSLLSTPPMKQLTFCNDSDFVHAVDSIQQGLLTSYKILIALLAAAALLAIIPHALWTWYEWVSLRTGRNMLSRALDATGKPADRLDLVLLAKHPAPGLLGAMLAKRCKNDHARNAIRWATAYVTTTSALFLLLLGAAGLLSCLLQYILLRSLTAVTPTAAQDARNLTELVARSLSETSATWANHTNTRIAVTQSDLNTRIFGWVETSTTALNTTLNVFTDELVHTLNTTFGGTPLYTPILEVLDCLLIYKLHGIETGLTWVHDHAHVTLPRVPPDVFALAPNTTDIAHLRDTASDQVTQALETVAHLWRASIREEAFWAGGVMGCWLVLLVFAGVRYGVVMWMLRKRQTVCKHEIGLPKLTPPAQKLEDPWLAALSPPSRPHPESHDHPGDDAGTDEKQGVIVIASSRKLDE